MADILTIILPTSWALFATYFLWYVTSAKSSVSITYDDTKALWHIHKKNAKCAGHKWHPILRKSGKISGFECECGYKYMQKRPIISSRPKNSRIDPWTQTVFSVTSYWISFLCLNLFSAGISLEPAETVFWNTLHSAFDPCLCQGTLP